jgi:hypothetical protein
VPDGVLAGQLVEVVKKWLREHPENWHYTLTASWLGLRRGVSLPLT